MNFSLILSFFCRFDLLRHSCSFRHYKHVVNMIIHFLFCYCELLATRQSTNTKSQSKILQTPSLLFPYPSFHSQSAISVPLICHSRDRTTSTYREGMWESILVETKESLYILLFLFFCFNILFEYL
jgi:hypothetical protein